MEKFKLNNNTNINVIVIIFLTLTELRVKFISQTFYYRRLWLLVNII